MTTPATPGALVKLTLQDSVRVAREGASYTYHDYLAKGVHVYLAADVERLLNELRQGLERIAKPALGGKAQQYEAQRLLATLKGRTA